MLASRFQDILDYSILKGFTGRERIENATIDPSKIVGLAADALGNFYLNAGTILTPVAGNKHSVLGGWVSGAGPGGEEGNNQIQGNNGTSPVAQVQKVTITGTPTGGTFTLIDEDGNVTVAIPFNATAAEVQTALRALPRGSGFTVTGGALPGTAVTVTSSGGLLGVKRTLTVGSEALTGGTTPKVAVTTTTEGGYVDGILGANIRFFDATSASTQAAAMYVHSCAFDATRIQNFAFYQQALYASKKLRNCRFENPS
jgi:hypothetical protein